MNGMSNNDFKIPYWALETDLKRWKIGHEVQIIVNDKTRDWAYDWQDQKLTIIGIQWNPNLKRVEIAVWDGYGITDEFSPDDFMSWL